jgi:hypothetical protein
VPPRLGGFRSALKASLTPARVVVSIGVTYAG